MCSLEAGTPPTALIRLYPSLDKESVNGLSGSEWVLAAAQRATEIAYYGYRFLEQLLLKPEAERRELWSWGRGVFLTTPLGGGIGPEHDISPALGDFFGGYDEDTIWSAGNLLYLAVDRLTSGKFGFRSYVTVGCALGAFAHHIWYRSIKLCEPFWWLSRTPYPAWDRPGGLLGAAAIILHEIMHHHGFAWGVTDQTSDQLCGGEGLDGGLFQQAPCNSVSNCHQLALYDIGAARKNIDNYVFWAVGRYQYWYNCVDVDLNLSVFGCETTPAGSWCCDACLEGGYGNCEEQ